MNFDPYLLEALKQVQFRAINCINKTNYNADNEIYISEGVNDAINRAETEKEYILKKLFEYQTAKTSHKSSRSCNRGKSGGCNTCHFWSGSISALSELLGNPGIID